VAKVLRAGVARICLCAAEDFVDGAVYGFAEDVPEDEVARRAWTLAPAVPVPWGAVEAGVEAADEGSAPPGHGWRPADVLLLLRPGLPSAPPLGGSAGDVGDGGENVEEVSCQRSAPWRSRPNRAGGVPRLPRVKLPSMPLAVTSEAISFSPLRPAPELRQLLPSRT